MNTTFTPTAAFDPTAESSVNVVPVPRRSARYVHVGPVKMCVSQTWLQY